MSVFQTNEVGVYRGGKSREKSKSAFETPPVGRKAKSMSEEAGQYLNVKDKAKKIAFGNWACKQRDKKKSL